MSLIAQAFIAKYPVPLRVFTAPGARPLTDAIRPAVAERGRLQEIVMDDVASGSAVSISSTDLTPGVLLLVPSDMTGPHRERLLEFARRLRPGRPILSGGVTHRDTLIDAINTWEAFMVIPDRAPIDLLTDVLHKAHDYIQSETAIARAALDLHVETKKLDETLQELRATKDRLRNAQRLSAIGQIATQLGPLFRDYISTFGQFESQVRPIAADLGVLKYLDRAVTNLRSIGALVDELRSYGQDGSITYQFEAADLDALVQSVAGLGSLGPAGDEKLNVRTEAACNIRADRDRIYQTMVSLLRAALQAIPSDGHVDARAFRAGKQAVVEIEVFGTSMGEEIQRLEREPFFTGANDELIGLGFRACQLVVERHGGTLDWHSTMGKGTIIRIALPVMP